MQAKTINDVNKGLIVLTQGFGRSVFGLDQQAVQAISLL
jgi:hypothetical protein